MKIRNGFVSNSSSSSFCIRNKTDKTLTMEDFVKENGERLLEEFFKQFTWHDRNDEKYTFENMLKLVPQYQATFEPHKDVSCSFGDEDYNVLGEVFDYMLREINESESFEWFCTECHGRSYLD